MARLSLAGSLVRNALLLILFSAVLKAASNALNVLACARHGVAAGHDCDCQHGRDDFQVHDRVLRRSPLSRSGQTLLGEPQGATRCRYYGAQNRRTKALLVV